MRQEIIDIIAYTTGATHIETGQVIQSLWSGYGEIIRIHLRGAANNSVILKHVSPPSVVNHPRNWHSDLSHQRKLQSYQVEMHWYEHFSKLTDSGCRTPLCYRTASLQGEYMILMEDLDAAGFSIRKEQLTPAELKQCLAWLASFHARFLHHSPDGLWPIGSYWHLATRPDEFKAMPDSALKQAATNIDNALNNCQFQTLIHGDAKVANFCFSDLGTAVAAVDFQYVGKGCGIKDIAYFLSSCLDHSELEGQQSMLLDFYFQALRLALGQIKPNIDANALEQQWRDLYPIAWADFHRFLAGWMPEHWKINHSMHETTEQALRNLAKA
ncbi:MAG: phosphotransferase [Mariprofundaceae bacterium]